MPADVHSRPERSRKVLLVDDEEMVLDLGRAILQRLGHEVLTANNGQAAIEQYLRYRGAIGCVVLDLTMPGMDGEETFRQLRKLNPTLPIIIASGLSTGQVVAQFQDQPPTAVIQKPYHVSELSVRIQAIFATSP